MLKILFVKLKDFVKGFIITYVSNSTIWCVSNDITILKIYLDMYINNKT